MSIYFTVNIVYWRLSNAVINVELSHWCSRIFVAGTTARNRWASFPHHYLPSGLFHVFAGVFGLGTLEKENSKVQLEATSSRFFQFQCKTFIKYFSLNTYVGFLNFISTNIHLQSNFNECSERYSLDLFLPNQSLLKIAIQFEGCFQLSIRNPLLSIKYP